MDALAAIDAVIETINEADDETCTIVAAVDILVTRTKGYRAGDPPDPHCFHHAIAGALASRISWAPNGSLPMLECWVITAVALGDAPAEVRCGPYNGEWYQVHPPDFPWFVASTAGAIRAAVNTDQPLVPKLVSDDRLFGKVRDGDPPSADQDGRL